MPSPDHTKAQILALGISNGINLLFRVWRKELGPAEKGRTLDELETLEHTIEQLRRLGTDEGLRHNFSQQQLETDPLRALRSSLEDWNTAQPLSDAVSELAGDCVERLTQQRPSQMENLKRGSQATIPLSSAVSKGIACLGSLRDNATLFSQKEARLAVDDLQRVLSEMPQQVQRDLGLAVSADVLEKLKQLRGRLVDEIGTADIRHRAGHCLKQLLGAQP